MSYRKKIEAEIAAAMARGDMLGKIADSYAAKQMWHMSASYNKQSAEAYTKAETLQEMLDDVDV